MPQSTLGGTALAQQNCQTTICTLAGLFVTTAIGHLDLNHLPLPKIYTTTLLTLP